jgi:hypothetical protein
MNSPAKRAANREKKSTEEDDASKLNKIRNYARKRTTVVEVLNVSDNLTTSDSDTNSYADRLLDGPSDAKIQKTFESNVKKLSISNRDEISSSPDTKSNTNEIEEIPVIKKKQYARKRTVLQQKLSSDESTESSEIPRTIQQARKSTLSRKQNKILEEKQEEEDDDEISELEETKSPVISTKPKKPTARKRTTAVEEIIDITIESDPSELEIKISPKPRTKMSVRAASTSSRSQSAKISAKQTLAPLAKKSTEDL